MKYFFLGLRLFLLIIGTTVAHMVVSYVLPRPFSYIDVTTVSLSLLLLLKENGSVVWVSAAVYFIFELYSSWPFGALLLPAVFSVLCMYWIYQYAFSNQSWYAGIAMSGGIFILFHAFQLIVLFCAYRRTIFLQVPSIFFFQTIGKGILATMVTTGIISLILNSLWRSLQAKKVISWISMQ